MHRPDPGWKITKRKSTCGKPIDDLEKNIRDTLPEYDRAVKLGCLYRLYYYIKFRKKPRRHLYSPLRA